MPRAARKKHNEAVYHIMMRGNNRQDVFFDDYDRERYLETIKRYKEKFQLHIYAYGLMDNEIHLIIFCNGQDISKVMHGINLSYTQYINRKYKRCGHLFQDRFKSIIIKDENIAQATKYVHLLPTKAGICKKASRYKWSSIRAYMGKSDTLNPIDDKYVLALFSDNKSKALELYLKFVKNNEKAFSDIERNVYENRDRRVAYKEINVSQVLMEVSKYFKVCVHDLKMKRSRRLAKARNIAAYLICLKCRLTYREIGEKLGMTGSAVGQSINKAVGLFASNSDMANCFNLEF